MGEETSFISPPNLFLLNPEHKTFLSGKYRHFRDHNAYLNAVVWGALLIIWLLTFGLPYFQAIIDHISLRQMGIAAEFSDGLVFINSISVIGVTLFIYLINRHIFRNIQLERKGHILLGSIVKVDGRSDRGAYPYRVEIKYRFRSPSGEELSRREVIFLGAQNKNLLPLPDTPIAVVYVNSKLFRVL